MTAAELMTQTTWKGSTLRYADTPGRAGMIVTWKGLRPRDHSRQPRSRVRRSVAARSRGGVVSAAKHNEPTSLRDTLSARVKAIRDNKPTGYFDSCTRAAEPIPDSVELMTMDLRALAGFVTWVDDGIEWDDDAQRAISDRYDFPHNCPACNPYATGNDWPCMYHEAKRILALAEKRGKS